MDNILIIIRTTHILFYVLFLIGTTNLVLGQELERNKEILVYFLPDSLEFPEGKTELKDKNKLKIKSKSLERTLKLVDLESINKAFPNFSENDTAKILRNGRKIKIPNMSRIFSLKLKKKDDIEAILETFSKELSVLFAERNGYASPDTEPSDPRYDEQWHLNNEGQSNGTPDADIDAPEAWDIFTGSVQVKIAVIDMGVYRNHPDLSGKVSGDQIVNHDHGTNVAGVAAAKANNYVNGQYYGVVGVDWNAQIIAKEFNYTLESGDNLLSQKIDDAVNEGAKVINSSYYLQNEDNSRDRYSTTMRMAYANAYKQNVVSVASAGNTGNSSNYYQYPAGFGQGIIAVGGTDRDDNHIPSSTHHDYVDVSAPGSSILTTSGNSNWISANGTSVATPIVSGIASLLIGFNPNLANDDVENIIKISAEDKNSSTYPEWDEYLGEGRVNAKKALDYLRPPWVVEHIEKTGGINNGAPVTYITDLYGINGLADGKYKVKRYPITSSVSLNNYYDEQYSWTRGVNTIGFSTDDPNFGMGWCEITSISGNTAYLRTYIYEVYNTAGTYYYGTFPANDAGGVKFCITILGKDLTAPAPPQNFDWHPDNNNHPVFTWTANTEPNLAGYNIYKKEMGMDWVKLNSSLITGTQYTDYDVIANPQGTIPIDYYATAVDNYQLESNPSDYTTVGTGWIFKPGTEDWLTKEIPDEYKLLGAYPNPFNPKTNIKYQIAEDGYTSLIVYNTVGQVVARLVDEVKQAGYYSVNFNASNLSSGMYIYRFQSGAYVDVKKMILMK